MNKIECLFTIFSALILMYATFYFMPHLIGKNHIYGVSINQEHRDYPDFIILDKKFKRLLSIGFIVIFILVLALVFIFDKIEFSYSISIIGFLLYESILYIYIHKKVKMTKSKFCTELSQISVDSKLVIDMDFINEKNKIIKKFKILYLIPVLLTFGMSIFILLNYNQLPDLITTHSTITGKPDVFMEKSYLGVFKLIGLEFCIMVLLYITSIGAIKARIKVDTNKIEESKTKNIKYLNKIGYLFFILMIMMIVQFFIVFLSLKINPNLLTVINIIMLLVIIYLMVTYINSPNLKSNSSYTPDNDEKYWIGGIIYNNPNDPSFMVDKRFGIGWTINLGNPIGKILYILIAVFLIFSLFSVIKSLLL
ncbi:DUF5808 domain-containing protein [Clostridioides sp. ZZV15-6388]|uniref:DUF5808 domain-containing protein n=1 Tax=unclassified Clostridioides TaxID=2635829 RepID=UPI001D112C7B|nr:hypothetical protein [Clostridioides sp. ZZV15-6388]MCC0664491.1 hypothetical protein [Clostridioides sp. ZZV15-6597]